MPAGGVSGTAQPRPAEFHALTFSAPALCVAALEQWEGPILTTEAVLTVASLMQKYQDLPMDFADATLVALAEESQIDRVFTLDRRGFSTYRIHGRQPFRLTP